MALARHCMIHDLNKELILIFGGIGKEKVENQMVQLDIKSMIWDTPVILSSIPPMRYSAADVYCPWSSTWFIIAGQGGKANIQKCKPLSDIWAFDLKAFAWKEIFVKNPALAPKGVNFRAVALSSNNALVVMGQDTSKVYLLFLDNPIHYEWQIYKPSGNFPRSIQGYSLNVLDQS